MDRVTEGCKDDTQVGKLGDTLARFSVKLLVDSVEYCGGVSLDNSIRVTANELIDGKIDGIFWGLRRIRRRSNRRRFRFFYLAFSRSICGRHRIF